MTLKTFISISICILNCALFNMANAEASFLKRSDVQRFIQHTAQKYQLKTSYISSALAQAKLRPRVIHSIKHPSEKKVWTDYRKLFITPKRIRDGRAFLTKHRALLTKAEKQYGIPAELIVAILGVETNYGTKQGSYRVLDSLSTLSFNYPKRARFFKKELANFLKLCKEQSFQPTSVLGSYAGAIGQPQFMPSSYRYYAVDFSGNGRIDLRHSTADAIGSIGNYLHRHGWQPGQKITEKAHTEGTRFKRFVTRKNRALYASRRVKGAGIQNKIPNTIKKVSMMKIRRTTKSQEYWLGYPNFYVITRYNTSKQYALAVYELSRAITAS